MTEKEINKLISFIHLTVREQLKQTKGQQRQYQHLREKMIRTQGARAWDIFFNKYIFS